MKKNKKMVIRIVALVFLVFVAFFGISYAAITIILSGSKNQIIKVGVLDLVLEEDNNNLNIENAYPTADEVAMIQEDPFTFRLVNNGSSTVRYKIKLVDITPAKKQTDQKCSELEEITLSSPASCRKLNYPDELREQMQNLCNGANLTTEEDCVAYFKNTYGFETFEELIDFYVQIGYFEDTRTIAETYPDNYVVIDFPRLSKSNVKYGLIKDGGIPSIDIINNIKEDTIDSGIIAGGTTYHYELRLWIKETVTDISLAEGKSLSYRIDVEVEQLPEYTMANNINEIMETSIDDTCTTYNDGVDTFLKGECSNNYVWYSGKLWRVVLENNETGVIKMVTDNAITTIPYNPEENNLFENSYADQWLNQEFLPTLHDTSTYLVENSIWDTTPLYSDANILRPTLETTVERTVGLLNAYEYRTTGAGNGFLYRYENGSKYEGLAWWTLTSCSNESYSPPRVYNVIYNNGMLSADSANSAVGIRPAINVKNNIQIISGMGTIDNPYILEGDIQEPVNGTTLLSTRYSGEYITFNNELYRIVGNETINGEVLTKITSVDKTSTLSSKVFNTTSGSGSSNFGNATIKTDLETYYQSLATSNQTAYNMIEPDTTWYLGALGYGVSYKTTICETVDATISTLDCTKITNTASLATASIALPRVGEMFTSTITRNTAFEFWTLTPLTGSYVRIGSKNDYLRNNSDAPTTAGIDVRPSMYLKANVVIASGNTGNGTYEYPYSIEIP